MKEETTLTFTITSIYSYTQAKLASLTLTPGNDHTVACHALKLFNSSGGRGGQSRYSTRYSSTVQCYLKSTHLTLLHFNLRHCVWSYERAPNFINT